MDTLPASVIASFNKGLKKLTGYARRSFAAQLAIAHFDGSARKTERALAVSRKMVELGLKEAETGIGCLDAHGLKGRKKKK
jgi:hypothetical protein